MFPPQSPISYEQMLEEIPQWIAHNFPEASPLQQFLGMQEELGEAATCLTTLKLNRGEFLLLGMMETIGNLCHSRLKRMQGIRGEHDEHIAFEMVYITRLSKLAAEYGEMLEKKDFSLTPTENQSFTRSDLLEDSIGDLSIFMHSMCSMLGQNPMEITLKVWEEVRTRDWKKFPKNGKDE